MQFYIKGTDKNGLVGTAVWDSDFSKGTFEKELINKVENMFKTSFCQQYACDKESLEIEFIGKDEYAELSGEPIRNISWGKYQHLDDNDDPNDHK